MKHAEEHFCFVIQFAAELYICIWKSILVIDILYLEIVLNNKKGKETYEAVIYSAFVNIVASRYTRLVYMASLHLHLYLQQWALYRHKL